MIKKIALFFIEIVFINNVYAGINGSADKRIVIGWVNERPDYIDSTTQNLWNTSPYNSIVRIERDNSYGTGEFISPRHILTNAHVAEKCGVDGKKTCDVYTSSGKIISAKAILWGIESVYLNGKNIWEENENKDWMILEVIDNYCHKEYRKLGVTTPTGGGLWRAGFGSLRVLTTNDIDAIRAAYKEYMLTANDVGDIGIYVKYKSRDFSTKYKTFLDKFKEITHSDFTEYLKDKETLKLIKDCKFSGLKGALPFVVKHTCDSWGGDSGSSIKTNYGNLVIGLETGSWPYITTNNEKDAMNSGIMSGTFLTSDVDNLIKKAEKDCEDFVLDVRPNLQQREINATCLASDLPNYAVKGHYIDNGDNKLMCGNKKCACAATACESGYYLAANAKGWSMGWCRSGHCPIGKHPNIVDGNKMTGCVDD